jgi:hypothetical protein
MANNLDVKDATGSTKTVRTIDNSGVHTPVHRIEGYDPQDDMVKVKSVQKKFRDSFVGGTLNAAKWDSSIGTGGAITVGSGLLTMGSGTTASSSTTVTTIETFTIPFRVNIGLTLTQRIANQTFLVEAISVDPVTLVPDGLHIIGMLWDGTTATQAKYRVQNSGAAPLDSGAVTFPTTASAGFYELEPFSDEAWFHGGTLDSTTGRTNSYRRHQQIPDPNAVFKVRLRWLNGGTPPASNTNAAIQYISIQDYAELTAEITGGRGQTVAGQALGVVTASGSVVSATITGALPAIVGQGAEDTAVAGNAVRVGARAYDALPAATVINGDAIDLRASRSGQLVIKPFAAGDLDFNVNATVTTNTQTAIRAAQAANIRQNVTQITYQNTNATATTLTIQDGSTTLITFSVPASMVNPVQLRFPTPLRGTAATALNYSAGTTGANVLLNVTGFNSY